MPGSEIRTNNTTQKIGVIFLLFIFFLILFRSKFVHFVYETPIKEFKRQKVNQQ